MVRHTQQRAAIRRVLGASNRPLSSREVLSAARAEVPGLGIATVYRHLKALLDEGRLAAVELPGEPQRFELAGKGQHHHFLCRACGRVFDLPRCEVDVLTTVPSGFQADAHTVLIYGWCADCTRQDAAPTGPGRARQADDQSSG